MVVGADGGAVAAAHCLLLMLLPLLHMAVEVEDEEGVSEAGNEAQGRREEQQLAQGVVAWGGMVAAVVPPCCDASHAQHFALAEHDCPPTRLEPHGA